MMRILIGLLIFVFAQSVSAQYRAEGLRLFADLPELSFFSNDLENIGEQVGIGLRPGFTVAGHYWMAKAYLGAEASADFTKDEIGDYIFVNPLAGAEVGAGLFRTNGNKCASKNNTVFTAIAKGGIRYNFGEEDFSDLEEPGRVYEAQMDPYIGAEFAIFYLKTFTWNNEFFVESGYFLESEQVYARFGFRWFLNVRS